MQGKIQKDGTILIRLDKKADKDLYAQTMEMYARNKWIEADHPRAKKPPEHAGEFIEKDDGPKIAVDPKAVKDRPYHTEISFPMFADTPDKQKVLERKCPVELKAWREAAMARVTMSITERQKHNKILDPAFKALKLAFIKSEQKPTWDISSKRQKQEKPEIEIPKLAKRQMILVVAKIKAKNISIKKVKDIVKAKTVKRKKES